MQTTNTRTIVLNPKKDFLDVVRLQIIDGPSPIFVGTAKSADDEFFPFEGSNATGLVGQFKSNMQQRQMRKNLKAKSKASARISKGVAKETKATSKVEQANSQKELAKNLSDSGADVQNNSVSSSQEKGMSTGAKIAIAGGVAAVLIITFVLIRKANKANKAK